MGLSEITYESVIKAIEEYRTIGKDNFLDVYGFGDARNYYLVFHGEEYPSKAIAGVAHKYIRPGYEPLSSKEFSGGKPTVERKLKSLGFNVFYKPNLSPIVLVENEVTYGGEYDHWQDLTGVTYHYPNQYRNKIMPGKYFIYYKGVRRAHNQRGQPEYFGYGRISSVWRDTSIPEDTPKARWRWYCSIDDYVPFQNPVLARQPDGYIENISNPLGWRTAVRNMTEQQFEKILSLAGINEFESLDFEEKKSTSSKLQFHPIDEVNVIESSNVLDCFIQHQNPAKEPLGTNKTTGGYRRSRNSKQIGDRAEEIVLRWLIENLNTEEKSFLTWVAKEGRTPGWDIEFIDENGKIIGVEVKGTTASIFQSVDITAHEWESARRKGDNYWLIFVVNCHSEKPGITIMKNPYDLFEKGEFNIEPLLWRLST